MLLSILAADAGVENVEPFLKITLDRGGTVLAVEQVNGSGSSLGECEEKVIRDQAELGAFSHLKARRTLVVPLASEAKRARAAPSGDSLPLSWALVDGLAKCRAQTLPREVNALCDASKFKLPQGSRGLEIALFLRVRPDGTVASATVTPRTNPGPPVPEKSCIEKQASQWRFLRLRARPTTFAWKAS